jgi:hypothetical protein
MMEPELRCVLLTVDPSLSTKESEPMRSRQERGEKEDVYAADHRTNLGEVS